MLGRLSSHATSANTWSAASRSRSANAVLSSIARGGRKTTRPPAPLPTPALMAYKTQSASHAVLRQRPDLRHHLPRSHLVSSGLARLARPGRRLFGQASCATPQRFRADGRVPPCNPEPGGPCHGRTPSSAPRRFEKQATSARGSPPVPISPQATSCNLSRGTPKDAAGPRLATPSPEEARITPPPHRSRASSTTSETARPCSHRNSCSWPPLSCQQAPITPRHQGAKHHLHNLATSRAT